MLGPLVIAHHRFDLVGIVHDNAADSGKDSPGKAGEDCLL